MIDSVRLLIDASVFVVVGVYMSKHTQEAFR